MKPLIQMPSVTENTKSGFAEDSDLQERIRVRAFELFEQRGCEPGHELEDWLQAKAEVENEAIAA